MFFALGAFGGGCGHRKPKSKPKKAPKDNWFERLNQSQLKELLSAAKLPVSGAKSAQIQRLLSDEATSSFAAEGFCGCTTDVLKERCKAAGLVQTGVKFDLALRLVQHTKSTGAPKRAATEADPETGAQVLKKRKPSTKPADCAALSARVEAKCYPDRSKWSNARYKGHATSVVDLAVTTLQREAVEKGFVASGDPFALDITVAVLRPLAAQWDNLSGQGYASWECERLADSLHAIVARFDAASPGGSDADADTAAGGSRDGTRPDLQILINRLDGCMSAYGIDAFATKEGLVHHDA